MLDFLTPGPEVNPKKEDRIRPPKRVNPAPIFILQTRCMFGGPPPVNIAPAVSEDGALALLGISPSVNSSGSVLMDYFRDPKGARLIHISTGSTIKEFLPPSNRAELNMGARRRPAVSFANNDDSIVIGWGEGYARNAPARPPLAAPHRARRQWNARQLHRQR